ncbi:MAG: DUF975 family protein [Clostridiales bacterium]|jgi:uncharacterized membrane protein|nr:DUF975 family protein [Clostridiales bacterium]
MKQRAEIKALARESFKEQRGIGILLYFLFMVIFIAAGLIGRVPFIGPIIFLGYSLIIAMVMNVGMYEGYLKIYRKEQTEIGVLFSKFNNSFGRALGGMLWMTLFIIIWSLFASIGGGILFGITAGSILTDILLDPFAVSFEAIEGIIGVLILSSLATILLSIPAIIKSIAYSMTPFILADKPNVKATEALKLSMKMTKGYKGNLFVMTLSFIGWFLLGCLTLGILLIVYVLPYYTTTLSGYYEELKEQALASGAITAEELA